MITAEGEIGQRPETVQDQLLLTADDKTEQKLKQVKVRRLEKVLSYGREKDEKIAKDSRGEHFCVEVVRAGVRLDLLHGLHVVDESSQEANGPTERLRRERAKVGKVIF